MNRSIIHNDSGRVVTNVFREFDEWSASEFNSVSPTVSQLQPVTSLYGNIVGMVSQSTS